MDYDVLIAGGGTSGAYAAFLLAGAGFSVVVAEKKIDAGSPPSGMCLIEEKSAKKYLSNWIRKSVAIHHVVEIEAFSESFTLNLKENNGIMQFNRDKLDRNILASGGNEGADILIRSELISYKVEKNEIHATLKSEGKEKIINAKYLIMATGAEPIGNALHRDDCRNVYFQGILSRGFFNQDSTDKLKLNIKENSIIVESRNQRFWEEAIIVKSHKSESSDKRDWAIKPSAVISYGKKLHTCVPQMEKNVIPIGESAGLFGEHTGFGIDMALESSVMAAKLIENENKEETGYESFISEINKTKERVKSSPSREKVLNGEIPEIESIVAYFRKI